MLKYILYFFWSDCYHQLLLFYLTRFILSQKNHQEKIFNERNNNHKTKNENSQLVKNFYETQVEKNSVDQRLTKIKKLISNFKLSKKHISKNERDELNKILEEVKSCLEKNCW